MAGDLPRVGLGEEHLEREGDHDDAHERGDCGFESAEPVALQRQDPEGAGARQEPGGEEGHPEEQVQAERGADHLGEVGRHRDRLRLHPEAERDRAREVVAAGFGEVLARRDPELGRERLDEHGHEVGRQHDPEEQVAVLGPAGDIGREVPGIDVRDSGDEGRPEERPEAAKTLALAPKGLLGSGESGRLAGKDVADVEVRAASVGGPRRPHSLSGLVHTKLIFRRIEILVGIRAER
jgi:hypothetical protein